MRNQKVLSNDQVNWYADGSKRLSYQMIFQEEDFTAPVCEEEVDIVQLLDERDARWEIKLQKAKDEAFALGYKKGIKEGLEQARTEIDDKIQKICTAFEEAHLEWQQRQQLLEPGLLDMVFEISESILGIPVENTAIRAAIEQNLGKLLQKVNDLSKPLLWISESDHAFVEQKIEEYAPQTSVNIRIDQDLNPGEFKLETKEETIVHNFQEMLQDFRTNLALPSWK